MRSRIMQRVVVALALGLACVAAVPTVAPLPEPNPRSLNLAMEAVQKQELAQAIASSPLSGHPMFQQIFARLDMNALMAQLARLMAVRFSEGELAALVRFQNSVEGRNIRVKMPAYQLESGAMVNNMMTEAFRKFVAAQAGQAGASNLPVQATPEPATPAGNGLGTPLRR